MIKNKEYPKRAPLPDQHCDCVKVFVNTNANTKAKTAKGLLCWIKQPTMCKGVWPMHLLPRLARSRRNTGSVADAKYNQIYLSLKERYTCKYRRYTGGMADTNYSQHGVHSKKQTKIS